VRGTWKVSIRRACRVLRTDTSTYQYRGRRGDQALRRYMTRLHTSVRNRIADISRYAVPNKPLRESEAMAKTARIPITNVFMDGDYTGQILVGPQQKPMNVVLDTGSSALALNGHKYTPNTAEGDVTTHLAQTDAYGDGSSWTGAVIKTKISIGQGADAITLPKSGNDDSG
jgi:hypothetical protein